MEKSVKDVLATAISDIGYWRWWDTARDIVQLEFGGVELFDISKTENAARSSVIALRFTGNSFIAFFDCEEENSFWYDKLHEDEIGPFTLDYDGFSFDDSNYALEVLKNNKIRKIVNGNVIQDLILSAKHLLTATCESIGFVVGGDKMDVIGSNAKYEESDITELYDKWWEYWRDYWSKRDTPEAYEKDYACEVTIPIRDNR